MARKNEQSEFVSSAGKVFEFVKAISDKVRALGGNDNDLRKVMADPSLCERVAQTIMGRTVSVFPSLTLAADLIPEGWEVVEDVSPSDFWVKDLEFFSFLKDGESYISGEAMRKRARAEKADLGLVDGKYLLAHQEEIRVELRGKYIPLPGTVLRDPGGRLYVPCLCWDGDRWCLDFDWLALDWRDRGRLARRK